MGRSGRPCFDGSTYPDGSDKWSADKTWYDAGSSPRGTVSNPLEYTDYITHALPGTGGVTIDGVKYTSVTVWGIGLISFGPPTPAQIAFFSGATLPTSATGFPGSHLAFDSLGHTNDAFFIGVTNANASLGIPEALLIGFVNLADGNQPGNPPGAYQATFTATGLTIGGPANFTVVAGGISGNVAYNINGHADGSGETLAASKLLTYADLSVHGVSGTSARDTLAGTAVNDIFDGLAGIDIATLAGTRAAATVSYDAARHALAIHTAAGGDDILQRVEQIRFSDGLYSFQFNRGASVIANFGASLGWTSQAEYPRQLADVNGDGKLDIVGFGFSAVRVALGNGDGTFQAAKIGVSNFGPFEGWTNQDKYPRLLADVNGDGRADIIGFGHGGTFVALARADGTFADTRTVTGDFSVQQGWTSQAVYVRQVLDVNGDGKKDLVGFGFGGVQVSLGNGDGTFQATKTAIANFGVAQDWSSQDKYPRTFADVNGDGKLDLVGFGYAGVKVALGNGDGTFQAAKLGLADFGGFVGWDSQDKFPRLLGDVNGDGRADIVGFGYNGPFVALARADGTFSPSNLAMNDFGVASGWTSQDVTPRQLIDINSDGKLDILGFGQGGTSIAYGNGDGTFSARSLDTGNFGLDVGWSDNGTFPRYIADLNGDNRPDILGFGYGSVFTGINQGDFLA